VAHSSVPMTLSEAVPGSSRLFRDERAVQRTRADAGLDSRQHASSCNERGRSRKLMRNDEFRQVAHSGGQIIIKTTTQPDGRRAYQLAFHHCRPVGTALFAVHVIPPGLPVGTALLGGIGSPADLGPVPGNFMAFVVSDSERMWGAQCPRCSAYWRSKSPSKFCVACGFRGQPHIFLTEAQGEFIQQYCSLFAQAQDAPDGEHVINLDAVADAVESVEKPPFYYAEESQQNKFTCEACGCVVDVLGKFGYCSLCGTRNDFQELTRTLDAIRKRINTEDAREACVRDTVAAFDSFVGQYVRELIRRVPMTKSRINRLENSRFHNINLVREELKNTFDVDIFAGTDSEDRTFAAMMFHRRHVYEHNGGEVDEDYISQSGDTSVRLKQALHETQDSAHRTVGIVLRMARNLHDAFHEILPPDEATIKMHGRR
jgi:hypothetical protein